MTPVIERQKERERAEESLLSLTHIFVPVLLGLTLHTDVGFSVVTVATHPDDKLGEFATPVLATRSSSPDMLAPIENRSRTVAVLT